MKKNQNLISNHAKINTKTGANIVKSLPTAQSLTTRGMENKEIKENVIPTIFKQNVKNNLKLRPFNDMISDAGDIQYFPA